MICRPRPEPWRARVAAAAAGGVELDVDDRLRAVLLDRLPYPQVLAALEPGVDRLAPAQVRTLEALAALDAGPDGRVYRWIWARCLWPFDWRLPPEASTRALTRAGVRCGLQSAGLALDLADLEALPGVRVRPVPVGPWRVALTLSPAALGLAVELR